jgi:hypothetical protein
MAITHSTVTAKPNRPEFDVSATAWNASHTIANDTITSAHILDDEIVNADVKTTAAIAQSKLSLDITNSEVNAAAAIAYSKLATSPRICRIKTGSYTGDGAAAPGGQSISGVGFTPKHLVIMTDPDGDNVNSDWHLTNDEATVGGAFRNSDRAAEFANMIISLDADGFTVGDYGADAHPNKNLQPYVYTAWG